MRALFAALAVGWGSGVVAARAQDAAMAMSARSLVEAVKEHGSSGTSVEPPSAPVPMLMKDKGAWMLMLHANAFAANVQQQAKGERGRDAWMSTNWVMPMAQRSFGAGGKAGTLTVRAMFSLEPATVGRRSYPLLFQQGETAYGKPIVDGQHPHDFLMEAAALYDLPLGKDGLLSFYAAPVGDPAVGPTAYPHRLTASEDPVAALGHHQEDSTHIAFNVLTGGLTYKRARVEVSGFHGGEPGETRWQPEPSGNGHAVDSVAGRLTVAPNADWTGQFSVARIASPEALHAGEDQARQTASVMFHHTFRAGATPAMKSMPGMEHTAAEKPAEHDAMVGMENSDMAGMDHSKIDHDMAGMDMGASGASSETAPEQPMKMAMGGMHMVTDPVTDFSATLVWGRTRSLTDASKENSYLAEALLRFRARNYVWTRMENAGRSNELLLTPGMAEPAGFREEPVGHVAAFTLGYDRDFRLGTHVLAAPGAQFTLYRTPQALRAAYGATPTAEVLFVRFRLH